MVQFLIKNLLIISLWICLVSNVESISLKKMSTKQKNSLSIEQQIKLGLLTFKAHTFGTSLIEEHTIEVIEYLFKIFCLKFCSLCFIERK